MPILTTFYVMNYKQLRTRDTNIGLITMFLRGIKKCKLDHIKNEDIRKDLQFFNIINKVNNYKQ